MTHTTPIVTIREKRRDKSTVYHTTKSKVCPHAFCTRQVLQKHLVRKSRFDHETAYVCRIQDTFTSRIARVSRKQRRHKNDHVRVCGMKRTHTHAHARTRTHAPCSRGRSWRTSSAVECLASCATKHVTHNKHSACRQARPFLTWRRCKCHCPAQAELACVELHARQTLKDFVTTASSVLC